MARFVAALRSLFVQAGLAPLSARRVALRPERDIELDLFFGQRVEMMAILCAVQVVTAAGPILGFMRRK